jgi:hypothetical protein
MHTLQERHIYEQTDQRHQCQYFFELPYFSSFFMMIIDNPIYYIQILILKLLFKEYNKLFPSSKFLYFFYTSCIFFDMFRP